MLQGPTNILKSHQGSTICKIFLSIFLTSLAKWGPGGGGGGFNNQTGPILVHIYPPFNNNLHVKYRICHVGPLHKTSSQWRHMYNKGKKFEKHFFIYGPKCKKNIYFGGYFGGPEGVFNDQTKPILLSSYPLTIVYVHVK